MHWASKKKVTLIVSRGSWYLSFAEALIEELDQIGFQTYLATNHLDIIKGSVAFYLSYARIVPEEVIERSFRSLVIHASNLPEGKGFSPWVWQILEGKNLIPMCLFAMTPELDAGNIFIKESLELNGSELLGEIRLKLADLKKKMILQYLTAPLEPTPYKQSGKSTFYPKRTPSDSELNPNESISVQFNQLRVADNKSYPSFFYHKGNKYILNIRKDENV